MDASDLDVESVGNRLKFSHVCSELRQLDVNRGSKSGAQISWTRSDVSEVCVVCEAGYLLDLGTCDSKSCENGSNISSILHRNNSKLVLFVDPNKEGLLVVVEDASAFGPVTVESASLEETITLFEEEVVRDELVSLRVTQGTQRVEGSSKLPSEAAASLNDFLLNGVPLLFRNPWPKRELSQVSADSNSRRLDHRGVFR